MIFFKFLFWPWKNVHQMAFISLIILIYKTSIFGFYLILQILISFSVLIKRKKSFYSETNRSPLGNKSGPIPLPIPNHHRIGHPLFLSSPLSLLHAGPTARSHLLAITFLLLPISPATASDPRRSRRSLSLRAPLTPGL